MGSQIEQIEGAMCEGRREQGASKAGRPEGPGKRLAKGSQTSRLAALSRPQRLLGPAAG